MPKKVLFFSDPGIDDAIALILAYLAEDIEIVGIVVDYGNVPQKMAMENTYFLKHMAGNNTIKIFSGAKRPLTPDAPTFFTDIHGTNGLGPIVPNHSLSDEQFENFFEVIHVMKEHKDDLIIVSLGRLTSLAILCILYETVMKQIQSYYVMGGAFLHPGNVTPVSEANFHGDPVAANIVLQTIPNISIYPLNVTQYSIVTPEMAAYIDAKGKAPLVKPLFNHYYYGYYQKALPQLQGCPLHDTIPIIALLDDSIFTYYNQSPVCIMNESFVRGQSIADFRSLANAKPFIDWPQQRIALDFDYNRFFKHFMTLMTGEQF